MTFNEGICPSWRDMDPHAVAKLDHDAEMAAIERHFAGLPQPAPHAPEVA